MSHLGFSLDQGVACIGAMLLVSLVARHAALMCSLRAPDPYIGHISPLGSRHTRESTSSLNSQIHERPASGLAEELNIQAIHRSFMATPVTEQSVRELERDIWVVITHFDRRQIA